MESKQRQDDRSMEVLMSILCNHGAYSSRVGRSRVGVAGGNKLWIPACAD